jgi:hypothetical protein
MYCLRDETFVNITALRNKFRRTCLSKKMKNSGTNGLKPIGEIQIGTNFSIGNL